MFIHFITSEYKLFYARRDAAPMEFFIMPQLFCVCSELHIQKKFAKISKKQCIEIINTYVITFMLIYTY